ncbi:MAG: type II secretion system F family protein [Candidatus Yonathbacteria bacterium]|nr:type II secretion system F family protein [Candidatus Yonathbacteria bacterium]NTW47791.1 type II secretion system F family protein [Candidatus Yonathbacteria bacterium]
MLFTYKIITQDGEEKEGSIDAVSRDVAIASLQRRGFIIVSLSESDEGGSLFGKEISLFPRVSNKDVVMLSRQIATLFDAHVSALRAFRLLATEMENPFLSKTLIEVSDDIQGGVSLSKALSRHTEVFSEFYVNMVKAGEESGNLNQTFLYLADYLDRSYELTSKTKNALVYPTFVVVTFVVVMTLMLTMVIPKLSAILTETGQEVPAYTKAVLAASSFLTTYGLFFLVLLIGGGIMLWQYGRTEQGKLTFARIRLETPYLGNLYTKLYLSRIADNMNTMLSSGISMVRAIEITSTVVGNEDYRQVLMKVSEAVKSGSALSSAMEQYPQMPTILVQMIRVGEETGELGEILKTLAAFYKREVDNAVDTLVGLIEPIMIVMLGLGVSILLASVLVPIYNITAGI